MATVSLVMHELTHHLPTDENLKKHVAAIQISNRLSLLERKISNVSSGMPMKTC